jgi:hypothetical protein
MKWFAEFFQEDNGGYSATRLGFLLWVIGSLAIWIVASLSSEPKQLAKVDSSVVTVIGILMTGKVAQKFGEKPETPPSIPSSSASGENISPGGGTNTPAPGAPSK